MTIDRPRSPTSIDVGVLAAYSAEAYREKTFEAPGDVEVLVRETRDDMIIAFRGTEKDGNDILRDLWAYPWYAWTERLGWCHRGFLAGARNAWPLLKPKVIAARKPIFVTGHSLGGAMATITGAMMVRAGVSPAAVVTFGCPNVVFGKTMDEVLAEVETDHYLMHGDPVTFVPWWRGNARRPRFNIRIGDTGGIGPSRHRIAGYIDETVGIPLAV